jgi:hypothetical protein
MTAPTSVWTILAKDRAEKPRGFEKGDGYYYMCEDDAKASLSDEDENYQQVHVVVECVIMSKENYDELVEKRA